MEIRQTTTFEILPASLNTVVLQLTTKPQLVALRGIANRRFSERFLQWNLAAKTPFQAALPYGCPQWRAAGGAGRRSVG